jgi:hypothetical protein
LGRLLAQTGHSGVPLVFELGREQGWKR